MQSILNEPQYRMDFHMYHYVNLWWHCFWLLGAVILQNIASQSVYFGVGDPNIVNDRCIAISNHWNGDIWEQDVLYHFHVLVMQKSSVVNLILFRHVMKLVRYGWNLASVKMLFRDTFNSSFLERPPVLQYVIKHFICTTLFICLNGFANVLISGKPVLIDLLKYRVQHPPFQVVLVGWNKKHCLYEKGIQKVVQVNCVPAVFTH